MSTVRLSTKGQIIIPKEIRQEHHWHQGTEFEIKDTPIKQFATFDKKFLNRAQKLTVHKMILPK